MSRFNDDVYKHYRYDESIMQSMTVGNIIDALRYGLKHRAKLDDVANFLINKRIASMSSGSKRKANSLDRKISRLKELGYEISKEGE
tara:strand:- start:74 stop:334 length:261 start_codon:yes stop_codon:yes gene_type:complete